MHRSFHRTVHRQAAYVTARKYNGINHVRIRGPWRFFPRARTPGHCHSSRPRKFVSERMDEEVRHQLMHCPSTAALIQLYGSRLHSSLPLMFCLKSPDTGSLVVAVVSPAGPFARHHTGGLWDSEGCRPRGKVRTREESAPLSAPLRTGSRGCSFTRISGIEKRLAASNRSHSSRNPRPLPGITPNPRQGRVDGTEYFHLSTVWAATFPS